MNATGQRRSAMAEIVELTRACGLGSDDPVLVAGADIALIDALLDAGHRDITVIDASPQALQSLREALGERHESVTLVEAEVPRFHPQRRYALWHDHGVFHALAHPDDRQRYVEVVQQALRPEGHLVLTTLASDSPQPDPAMPLPCYSVQTLTPVLGGQFELMGHALSEHLEAPGKARRLLHCRFRRHAPRWPASGSGR